MPVNLSQGSCGQPLVSATEIREQGVWLQARHPSPYPPRPVQKELRLAFNHAYWQSTSPHISLRPLPLISLSSVFSWLSPSKYSRLLLSYPLPSGLLFPRINNPNWFNLSVELFRGKRSIIILSKKSNNSHNCLSTHPLARTFCLPN